VALLRASPVFEHPLQRIDLPAKDVLKIGMAGNCSSLNTYFLRALATAKPVSE
jgi:hypothetical protein